MIGSPKGVMTGPWALAWESASTVPVPFLELIHQLDQVCRLCTDLECCYTAFGSVQRGLRAYQFNSRRWLLCCPHLACHSRVIGVIPRDLAYSFMVIITWRMGLIEQPPSYARFVILCQPRDRPGVMQIIVLAFATFNRTTA